MAARTEQSCKKTSISFPEGDLTGKNVKVTYRTKRGLKTVSGILRDTNPINRTVVIKQGFTLLIIKGTVVQVEEELCSS